MIGAGGVCSPQYQGLFQMAENHTEMEGLLLAIQGYFLLAIYTASQEGKFCIF